MSRPTAAGALAALLLAVPAPAPADDAPRLRQAAAALADEDLEAARADLAPLLAEKPGDPSVLLLGGVLRFHEQRYAEAAELLERAGEGTLGGIDYLALARAARDRTRDWKQESSEHFTVSYPPGKDEVLVPYLLEALEAQRAALQEDLGKVPPGKVVIEILPGTRDLSRLSSLTEEEIRTSGTIALCKFNKLMIVSPKALLKGYDWLDTAAHEYTHHVVTQLTGNNTPIWLHEGIAKYSETRWRGKGGESLSPYAAALLQDAVKKNRLITFEQMHPSMAKLPSQEAATLAFAEVMVAVEWLHKKGGPALLGTILARIGGRIPLEKAFHEAGLDFDHFLAEWKKYLAVRPLPAGGEVEARKLRFNDDPRGGTPEYAEWAELPDDRARRYARLGEIFRERGRWAAARVEYGKAVQRVGPRFPVLTSKFALAALLSGKESEAESALLEAARTHPHYAALHVNLGRIRAKRQDWKGAREAFLLANRVDPFDPEIHAGLASAAEAEGDAATAARERRFAQLLASRGPVRAPHAGDPVQAGAPPPPAAGERLHGTPPPGAPPPGPHGHGNSPH